MMPHFYKEKRDELDDILWHFNVPKKLYNRLIELRQYLLFEIEVHSITESAKVMRALELIEEIMPRIGNMNKGEI